jgi:uncharacterized ParB-like nuclease family protein
MSIPTVNYREVFFEHPDLSRIIGIPTYETLHTLNQELKSNAMSVHSNLGGGQHGHLGLVVSPNACALLANMPCARPGHPAPLAIPQNASHHLQNLLERTHQDGLRVFHEVRGVERALTQQIVAAVDSSHLAAMRNRTTGQFTGTVCQLLQCLLTAHGKISPSQLLQLEQETKSFTYDPITPIDVVFKAAEDLVECGEMAHCTCTMAQTINIAYSIHNRTTKFRDSIKVWNRLPTLHKTWISFKLHFREAHDELQETGELKMGDTGGHHQANLIEAIANRVAELQTPHQESAPTPAPAMPTPAPAMPAPDAMLPAIVAQMQQMQQMMAAMQANSTPRKCTYGLPSRTSPANRTKDRHSQSPIANMGHQVLLDAWQMCPRFCDVQ